MVGAQEAAVRAAGLVQDGISTGQWAGLMDQFNMLLAGRDVVIRRAAALAPLLLNGQGPTQAPFVVELASGRGEFSVGEHRLVRLATLQATRAATVTAKPAERLLLAGVERELLEGAAAGGSVESALRGWRSAMSSTAGSVSPATALSIAWTQRALLRRGVALLERYELVDGVGQERLLGAVEASNAAWDRAHATWRDLVPHRQTSVHELGRATVGLQLALRDADDAEVLQQLVRTGFGGNLIAALAVTPVELRQGSELVTAAMSLEPKTDVATTFRPPGTPRAPENVIGVADQPVRPTEAQAGRSAEAQPGRPAEAQSGRAAEAQPERSTSQESQRQPRERSGVEVERVELMDKAGLAELARLRDVGVLAGAALAGVAAARQVVGDASASELGELVELGARARTAIGEAGLPMVRHWAKKLFGPGGAAEFTQAAVVPLMVAAGRWDPAKASWSTYAYQTARFEFYEELERRAARREFPSGDLVEKGLRDPLSERVFGGVAASPEEVVVAATERHRAQQLLGQVPPLLREAVVTRMGEVGGEKATFVEVGERLGVAPTTAMNRVGEGIDRLRQLADHETAGGADLRNLAIALRSASGPPSTADRARDRCLPSAGEAGVNPSCA